MNRMESVSQVQLKEKQKKMFPLPQGIVVFLFSYKSIWPE